MLQAFQKIPENYKETYSDLLKDFDHVSVREIDGKKQIEPLTGKNIEIVLDPTLLLSKNEWKMISKNLKTFLLINISLYTTYTDPVKYYLD